MKFKLKNEIFPLFLILAAIILSAAAYPHLPLQVASHWNFQGQVNGYMSRGFNAIFFPALLAVMYVLFLILPVIDPRRENYEKFAPAYHALKNLIIFVLFAVYAAAILSNLGVKINIALVISFIIGVMMVAIGFFLNKIKENWFIGIRTPWTLSSPAVWEKTHKVGGRLFMLFGVIIIIAPYITFPYGIILFAAGALMAVLGSVLYSYFAFQKEKKSPTPIKK